MPPQEEVSVASASPVKANFQQSRPGAWDRLHCLGWRFVLCGTRVDEESPHDRAKVPVAGQRSIDWLTRPDPATAEGVPSWGWGGGKLCGHHGDFVLWDGERAAKVLLDLLEGDDWRMAWPLKRRRIPGVEVKTDRATTDCGHCMEVAQDPGRACAAVIALGASGHRSRRSEGHRRSFRCGPSHRPSLGGRA